MTLGLDILLPSVDPDLRIVWEREYTGYAMRAADLIELAVARRVETRGKWSNWIHVLDARPAGEPRLDASLASLATSRLDRFTAAGAAADVLDWAFASLVHECDLWIPGHYDRAAWRTYKEAARGQRGTDPADPVEATIRVLMRGAHNARNLNL